MTGRLPVWGLDPPLGDFHCKLLINMSRRGSLFEIPFQKGTAPQIPVRIDCLATLPATHETLHDGVARQSLRHFVPHSTRKHITALDTTSQI